MFSATSHKTKSYISNTEIVKARSDKNEREIKNKKTEGVEGKRGCL